MLKWSDEYRKVHPDVAIDYEAIGSGGGIQQLLLGTVDFGATHGPMTEEQLRQAKTPILHFPTALGADVPTYNIPGVSQELNFAPEALAGIFLGTITEWDDPELARANAGVTLPANKIVVVHRSDRSGTTYAWTDYLSKVSELWKSKVGTSLSVAWPVVWVVKIRFLRKISDLHEPAFRRLSHVNWAHDSVSSGFSLLVRCLLPLAT